MLSGKAKWLSLMMLALGLSLTPALSGLAASAAEEQTPTIKQMKLSIWPEYDESSVLVMYSGEFAQNTAFPREVSLRTPKDARITVVEGDDPKGQHLDLNYKTKEEADYKVVSFTLPNPVFRFEYYFNPIGSEPLRNIDYAFSATYPIDKMEVEIQQPLRSTEFKVDPVAAPIGADKQGLKYSQLVFSNVPVDRKIELKLSYSKPDNRPSASKDQASTSGGEVSNSSNSNIGLLFIGIGVVGLLAGLAISWRQRRLVPRGDSSMRSILVESQSRPMRSSMKTAAESTSRKSQAVTSFCTGCGAAIEATDHFCRFCGNKSKRGAYAQNP
ncbi:MAG: zinc ribbon domain-containing protein [Dehalococcoidales bacterium]|nr:zinc ribbon domain-containing protein [Dehalococcoidales bacterium]